MDQIIKETMGDISKFNKFYLFKAVATLYGLNEEEFDSVMASNKLLTRLRILTLEEAEALKLGKAAFINGKVHWRIPENEL